MSKGSNRRPQEADEATMAENWARAFAEAERMGQSLTDGLHSLNELGPNGTSSDGKP